MKISQTSDLMFIIAGAYSNFQSSKERTAIWHKMLGDLDYTIAEMAVQKLISESPYPPTIHDIRKRVVEVQFPDLPTAAEAWGIMLKNIRNYGSYRVQEGLDALPPVVKEVAQYMGYKEICQTEEPEGVTRAHFMKMYEQILNRRKGEQILPLPLQQQIKALSGNMKMLEG